MPPHRFRGYGLLAAALAMMAGVATPAHAAEAVSSPEDTAILRQFSNASKMLYKRVSSALVRVRIDQDDNVLIPDDWRKQFEEWRNQAVKERRAGVGGPETAPQIIIQQDRNRPERDVRATTRPARPASPPAAAHDAATLQLMQRWLRERISQGDVQTAVRARQFLQRLEAVRSNQGPDVLGVVIQSDGTTLVMTTLLYDLEERNKKTVKVVLADGTETSAKVLGSDPLRNLSLIQLEKTPANAASPAISRYAPGDMLLGVSANTGAVGWLVAPASAASQPRRTAMDERFPMAVGDDRGPSFLFDADGNLTALGFERSVVSLTTLKAELDQLARLGIVPRRQLGVRWAPITLEERQSHAKLGQRPAVRVDGVVPDSLAARAGLKKGDYVLSVDNLQVQAFLLPRIQAELAARTGTVNIGVLRGDEELTLELPLDKK